jgi:hypothetical protein
MSRLIPAETRKLPATGFPYVWCFIYVVGKVVGGKIHVSVMKSIWICWQYDKISSIALATRPLALKSPICSSVIMLRMRSRWPCPHPWLGSARQSCGSFLVCLQLLSILFYKVPGHRWSQSWA